MVQLQSSAFPEQLLCTGHHMPVLGGGDQTDNALFTRTLTEPEATQPTVKWQPGKDWAPPASFSQGPQ